MFRIIEVVIVGLAVAFATGAEWIAAQAKVVSAAGMPNNLIVTQPCPCGGLMSIDNPEWKLHCPSCGRYAAARARD
jgi:hypothetical protein